MHDQRHNDCESLKFFWKFQVFSLKLTGNSTRYLILGHTQLLLLISVISSKHDEEVTTMFSLSQHTRRHKSSRQIFCSNCDKFTQLISTSTWRHFNKEKLLWFFTQKCVVFWCITFASLSIFNLERTGKEKENIFKDEKYSSEPFMLARVSPKSVLIPRKSFNETLKKNMWTINLQKVVVIKLSQVP